MLSRINILWVMWLGWLFAQSPAILKPLPTLMNVLPTIAISVVTVQGAPAVLLLGVMSSAKPFCDLAGLF